MTPEELKTRTKALALRVIHLARTLTRDPAGRTVADQIVRSATSVGANYRAACRAQSRAAFAAKLAIAEEEVDETLYWLEILADSGLVRADRLEELIKETREIVAIITTSRRTTNIRSK